VTSDIWTMAWKEWREWFARQGRFRGGWINVALTIAVFGVILPWQFGRAWVESPAALMAWIWLPLFVLSNLVVDAVAGERERHTLETLLASRLPNRAILLGKIGAASVYGVGVTAGSLLAGAVTVNVMFWDGTFRFYPGATLLGALLVAVIGSTLISSLGVLVSLRATSVRQAGQMMGLSVLAIGFSPLLLVRVLSRYWPVHGVLAPVNFAIIAILAMGGLMALDVGLFVLVLARFQRSRLIVE